jgi:AmiR/NasT family two-component response regulator
MTAAPVDLDPNDMSSNTAPTLSVAGSTADPATVDRAETLATVTDVTDRIAGRQIIDRAKQLLMTERGMTEPEAHRWIQKASMDRRSPKVQIATGIVAVLGALGDKSSGTG